MIRYLSSIATFALLLLLPGTALAERPNEQSEPETVTIPLDQIWAYNMPGTRDVQQLGMDRENSGRSLVALLSESLVIRAEKLGMRGPARPGFAVKGTGRPALQAAYKVLAEGAKPQKEFSSKDKITLVFFAEPTDGNRVHLRRVQRQGNEIGIHYRLEPYSEKHLSFNFALIPLSKLSGGTYHVDMRQLPIEQEFIDWGFEPLDRDWSRRFLCKPFSFVVAKDAV